MIKKETSSTIKLDVEKLKETNVLDTAIAFSSFLSLLKSARIYVNAQLIAFYTTRKRTAHRVKGTTKQ